MNARVFASAGTSVSFRDQMRAKLNEDQKRLVDRIDEQAHSAWSHLNTREEAQARIKDSIAGMVSAFGANELPTVIDFYRAVLGASVEGAQRIGTAATGGRNSGLEVPRAILDALVARSEELKAR